MVQAMLAISYFNTRQDVVISISLADIVSSLDGLLGIIAKEEAMTQEEAGGAATVNGESCSHLHSRLYKRTFWSDCIKSSSGLLPTVMSSAKRPLDQ